jgi:hypothetical protein
MITEFIKGFKLRLETLFMFKVIGIIIAGAKMAP